MPSQHFIVPQEAIPPRLNIAHHVLDRQIAAGLGERIALLTDQGAVTYAELHHRVAQAAGGLARHGIAAGDPVLIRLWNSPEFAVAVLALLRLGAVPVLQNSLLGADEVAYVREHSQAVAAITFDELAEPLRRLTETLPKGLIVARGSRNDETVFEDLFNGPPTPSVDTAADDRALIVYTSGTTGRPKGIVHAHRWIVALASASAARIPPQPGDIILATGEWSFISALGHNLLFPLANGVTGAILEGRAQADRVLEAVARHRVTVLYSVATVYRRLLAIPEVERQYDFSSLRGVNSVGEALQVSTYDEWMRRVGVPLWEHFGVSEAQMVLGQGPGLPIKPGSVGVPWGMPVAILDDHGQEVPVGEMGELVLGSAYPGFFLGYHADPAKTAEVLHGGWYHTGDLARIDGDGYVWICGRKDDCFKSRGIFISPLEIEDVLRGHAAVSDACVLPLPDAEIGNRIRAVVELRGEAGVLPEALRAWVRERIAPYKVPHVIELTDTLPRNPVGKISRRALLVPQHAG